MRQKWFLKNCFECELTLLQILMSLSYLCFKSSSALMMKTILLFLSIFCCLNLSGQSVDIPDATFKSYLLGNSNINTNNDAEIQDSEANSFQGNIDVKYLYITNLTGIEAFINLDSLNCYGTYLTNLDLSQNINLKHLEFGGWNTNFTTIDLSQNINLESLRYSLTSIESLDLTLNTKLEFVDINSNYLNHLDVSGLSFLSWLDLSPGSLLTLNASACTSLTHFGFSQSYAMESADFSGCISLEYLNIQAGLTHLYIAGCGAFLSSGGLPISRLLEVTPFAIVQV